MSWSSSRQATPEDPGQLSDSSAPKEETVMAYTRKSTRRSDDARIIEEHRIAGRHDEGETDASDCGGRRWYDLRPEPRRRSDVMGFNSTWWMAVVWVVVILVVAYPSPWWW
jgi:hypothetical protein